MKKTLLNLMLLCIAGVLFVSSCRKFDHHFEQQSDSASSPAIFFGKYSPQNDTVLALHWYFKREDSKYHFAEKYLKKLGIPRWNKARVFSSALGQQAAARGESFNNGDSSIVYIPIARDSQRFVNSALVVKIRGADTTVRLLYDWQYKYAPSGNTTTSGWSAHNVFQIFSMMDKDVFGVMKYRLTDKYLFTQEMLNGIAEKKLPIDSLEVEVTMNEAGNIASRGLITITYCNNVSYCIKFKKKETTLLGFRQSGSTPQVSSIVPGQECEQLGYYTVCSTVWIYDYSNPGDPFGGGGGGENGGGGGGSGGGSGDNGGGSGGWQDPIGPLPCDENGQPANSFENPCNQGGWVPVFDPNKVDIDPSIYL